MVEDAYVPILRKREVVEHDHEVSAGHHLIPHILDCHLREEGVTGLEKGQTSGVGGVVEIEEGQVGAYWWLGGWLPLSDKVSDVVRFLIAVEAEY